MGLFGFGGSSKSPDQLPESSTAKWETYSPPTVTSHVENTLPQKNTDSTENIEQPKKEVSKLKPMVLLPKDATLRERFDAWGRTVLPLGPREELSVKVIFTVAMTSTLLCLHSLSLKRYMKMSKELKKPWIQKVNTSIPVGLWSYFMFREWFMPLVLKTDAQGKPYPRSYVDFLGNVVQEYKEQTEIVEKDNTACDCKFKAEVEDRTSDASQSDLNVNVSDDPSK